MVYALGKTESRVPMGKSSITREEAQGFLDVLIEITKPITDDLKTKNPEACVRDIAAGQYPILIRLRDRLIEELARGTPMIAVSQGELNVAEKAVVCAEALGTIKVTRTVIAAGAGVGALALLFFLL